MEWYEASARVAAVCAAFALIHSVLVTGAAKNVARRIIGAGFVRAYYRLAYTAVSAITTALAVYLILLVPDVTLLVPPPWLRVPGHAMQLAGIAVGAVAYRNIRIGEFTGLTQAGRRLRHEEQEGDEEGLRQSLVTTGIYARVRHPLYLAGILIFTFNPYLTRNWLTVSLMADIYFVLGALIEERRLIGRFGREYRRYMERVPRFVPRIF
jgi:protein-S-isoprenylcysteine O-methyltransferase Ste14